MLEKRFCRTVTVNEIQFCSMPERGSIDAVFILKRLQEEYHAKGKVCFMDIEKAFDRVPRKELKWAMRKKEIPALARSVMRKYEGAKIRDRVDSQLSESLRVK